MAQFHFQSVKKQRTKKEKEKEKEIKKYNVILAHDHSLQNNIEVFLKDLSKDILIMKATESY